MDYCYNQQPHTVNWQGETFCLTELDSTVDCKMSWYRIVHVLIPYNIKLYTALHSSEFDYRGRVRAGSLSRRS